MSINVSNAFRTAAIALVVSAFVFTTDQSFGQGTFSNVEALDMARTSNQVSSADDRPKAGNAAKQAEPNLNLGLFDHEAGDRRYVRINGVVVTFRWIPAGQFLMGDDERSNARPVRLITISRGFWLAETETTQRLWEAVMGNNPCFHKGYEVDASTGPYMEPYDNLPVENVSWEDCCRFARRINDLGVSNGEFRLPTEAEWEYACRAGTTGDYNVDGEKLDDLGWYRNNSDKNHPVNPGKAFAQTHVVGLKLPNAWGLYDMLGNVNEWTSDWLGDYSDEELTDPVGPSDGEKRVLRGGCYMHDDVYSSFRAGNYPDGSSRFSGFRLLLTEPKQ